MPSIDSPVSDRRSFLERTFTEPARIHSPKPIMTPKERAKYNFRNAILASDCSRAPEPCFEVDVSEQITRQTGQRPAAGGVLVPAEIYAGEGGMSRRALSASIFAAGGATVGEEVSPLYAYLFPQSVALGLGARAFVGLGANPATGMRGNIRIPVGSSSDEAEWCLEDAAPAGNHDSAFTTANGVAKRLYAQRRISRQLLIQSAQGAAIPEILLMASWAAAWDRAALAGTGGVQPLGLLYTSGVATVSLGTDGAAPTLAALNDCEGNVITAKVPLTSPGYVLSPNTRKKLKNTQKATGTSSFLLETHEDLDRCNGFTAYGTAYMPDTLAKGSGSNLGSAIFGGGWEWLFCLQWGALEVLSNPYTYAASGDVLVSLNGFADIVTPRSYAFSKIVDVVTT